MPTDIQLEILKRAPKSAAAVRVIDMDGSQKWRTLPGLEGPPSKQLLDTDVIELKKDEYSPVVRKDMPGRISSDEVMAFKDMDAKKLARVREMHVQDDPLVQLVSQDPDSIDVYREIARSLAREVSQLEFLRMEAERTKDGSLGGITSKKIQALQGLLSMWFKRYDQVAVKGLDIESDAFLTMFKYIVETFEVVLKEVGLDANMIKSITASLARKLSDESWKIEAKNRLREQ